MTDIKEILFELSAADCAGTQDVAAVIAEKMLSRFCKTRRNGHTVIGEMPGDGKTLLLDAHIDEIALAVTDIDENGFLTVAPCGGFDLRTLPARPVTVHGKTDIPAVFCSNPPHLGGLDKEFDDISKLKIDTLLGAAAKEQISIGDTVTFRMTPAELSGGRVTGKAFDDRACVACLISLAEKLAGKALPMNIVFLFSDQEELGMRGARTAAYGISADEAIALDVSFGDGPSISQYECGNLGEGPMIGVSPVLDSRISGRLLQIAAESGIKNQTEVMGGRTGTNADVISVTKSGIPTGLVSIPIRNMHTPVEVADIADIAASRDLLEQYILKGGALS